MKIPPPFSVRRPSSNRERGAALIGAVLLALVLSLTVGAAVTYVGANYRANWAKSRSESALLLAEAAVNNEIAYIQRHQLDAQANTRSTQPTTIQGNPYPGRAVTYSGLPGTAYVFTSTDEAGTTAWTGTTGTFYVTTTAVVQGSRRKIRIRGKRTSGGAPYFGDRSVFGVDSNGANNRAALIVSSNTPTYITGGVGTNGGRQGTRESIVYDHALNANTAVCREEQLTNYPPNQTKPIATQTTPVVFKSVTQVLRETFPQMGSTNPWTWIAANNNNANIRCYQSTSPALTPSGTRSAGFLTNQHVLMSLSYYANPGAPLLRVTKAANGNQDNYPLGSWNSIPFKPGGGRRTLIFPPGEYYFSTIEVQTLSTIEFVVDTAGLTVGGNSAQQPVRFWIYDPTLVSQWDFMDMPFVYTGAADPKLLRFMFMKPGPAFRIARTSSSPTGVQTFHGLVYGVGDNPNSPVQIFIHNDLTTTANEHVLYGSFIADHAMFMGACRVIGQSNMMNPSDLGGGTPGVGYDGEYVDVL